MCGVQIYSWFENLQTSLIFIFPRAVFITMNQDEGT